MAKKDRKQRKQNAQRRKQKREAAKRNRRKEARRQADVSLSRLLGSEASLKGCYISPAWEESGMATIVVGRQLPDGITAGMFLVDMACYGLKDAFGLAGLLPSEFGGILDEWGQPSGGFQPCGLDLARELVWGGIAWARKWSFSLPKN